MFGLDPNDIERRLCRNNYITLWVVYIYSDSYCLYVVI